MYVLSVFRGFDSIFYPASKLLIGLRFDPEKKGERVWRIESFLFPINLSRKVERYCSQGIHRGMIHDKKIMTMIITILIIDRYYMVILVVSRLSFQLTAVDKD